MLVSAAGQVLSDWKNLFALILAISASLSIWAGIQLWRGKAAGRRASILLQGLQSIGVSIPGLAAFALRLGFSFDIVWKAKGATRWPSLYFVLGLGHHAEPFRIALNVLAIVLFLILNALNVPPAPVRLAEGVSSMRASV